MDVTLVGYPIDGAFIQDHANVTQVRHPVDVVLSRYPIYTSHGHMPVYPWVV